MEEHFGPLFVDAIVRVIFLDLINWWHFGIQFWWNLKEQEHTLLLLRELADLLWVTEEFLHFHIADPANQKAISWESINLFHLFSEVFNFIIIFASNCNLVVVIAILILIVLDVVPTYSLPFDVRNR